ncbi:MAG: alpha-1 4-glucan-protein synthase [archaeon]
MTPEPDTCVIVPTIRDYEAMRAYFENARQYDFDLDRVFVLLVTEDFCDTSDMREMLEEEGVSGAVFDESAREQWFDERGLSEYTHLVPEASHAQTSFGLLYLWDNDDFEYGFFIDDDTRPDPDEDFFGTQLRNLEYEGELPAIESDERWVNVLYQSDNDLYPRGYPYAAMGENVTRTAAHVDDVVASQGLWTNVPDLDAVRILMDGDLDGQAQTRTTADDFEEDFVAAPGNYLTVCSMNLAFERAIVPAFYQLPMDDNPWDVGRFDDIWSGIFLKRACDVLDKQIYNGRPLCRHDKAPRSTFDDLQNEVAGLELNEHLWEVVDETATDAASFAGVFRAIADELVAGDWSDWNNGEFLNYCGTYMQDWLDCLDAIESRQTTEQPVASDD